jgi:hypothetical protein
MFRENRKTLVDNAEQIIRNNWLVKNSGITDKTICFVLRAVHFVVPLFTGLILLFGTKFWFFVVIFINLLIYALFFIFEGCILSSLEQRFATDDFTVIDPLLMFLRADLTKENREKYTIISNIITSLFTVVLYYVRFS